MVKIEPVKFCKKCGLPISAVKDGDSVSKQMRHIRVKYCKSCAEIASKENARQRQERYRRRHKKDSDFYTWLTMSQKRKLALLEEENRLLTEVNARLNRELDKKGW